MQREGVIWDAVAGKAPRPNSAVLLGETFLELEPGRSRMQFVATEQLYNPGGVVHGGMLAAMLDDTLGPAAASTVEPDQFVTTVEMKVNFLRPAKAGVLIGDGRVVHKGRSIIFLEGTLTGEDGAVVATATGTWRVVPLQNRAAGKDGSE